MLSGTDFALVGLAGLAAGIINSVAGGGTLVSFPVLVGFGIPEVAANVTNTIALCPGYLGGAFAQREDLRGQGRRLLLLVPAGIAGGVAGAVLLLSVPSQVFRVLVPFLILLAAVILAVQDRVRRWVEVRAARVGSGDAKDRRALFPVGLAAVYGGYFGAGLSVIVLAVLGLFFRDNLTRLNALKQCISLAINVAAAVFFLFSGVVVWPVAAVMAAGAYAGGTLGGNIARRIDPAQLRWAVVAIGFAVGLFFLVNL